MCSGEYNSLSWNSSTFESNKLSLWTSNSSGNAVTVPDANVNLEEMSPTLTMKTVSLSPALPSFVLPRANTSNAMSLNKYGSVPPDDSAFTLTISPTFNPWGWFVLITVYSASLPVTPVIDSISRSLLRTPCLKSCKDFLLGSLKNSIILLSWLLFTLESVTNSFIFLYWLI